MNQLQFCNENILVVETNNSKCKKVLEFHQFNWIIKLKVFPEIIDRTHYYYLALFRCPSCL